jgi:hypothetical protein
MAGDIPKSDVAARDVQAATLPANHDSPCQNKVSELCGRRHRAKGQAEAAKSESLNGSANRECGGRRFLPDAVARNLGTWREGLSDATWLQFRDIIPE